MDQFRRHNNTHSLSVKCNIICIKYLGSQQRVSYSNYVYNDTSVCNILKFANECEYFFEELCLANLVQIVREILINRTNENLHVETLFCNDLSDEMYGLLINDKYCRSFVSNETIMITRKISRCFNPEISQNIIDKLTRVLHDDMVSVLIQHIY